MLNNEGLDRLFEQLLENYETDDSSYTDTVSEDDDETAEVEETLPTSTTMEETTTTVDVEEPMKEIHFLNQYIHLNDEELHTVFSKNTCAELFVNY